MTHIKPTATPAWQVLAVHYDKIKTLHLPFMQNFRARHQNRLQNSFFAPKPGVNAALVS
jgi:hypothetical protein